MGGLFGNPLSGAGVFIQGGAVLGAFVVAFLLSEWVPLAAAERSWWMAAALPVGGIFSCVFSLRLLDRVRDRLRFRVFPEVAFGVDRWGAKQ